MINVISKVFADDKNIILREFYTENLNTHRFLIMKGIDFIHSKKLTPTEKEIVMFNKNKKRKEIRPVDKLSRQQKNDQEDEKNKNILNNKGNKKEKADMQSEGGTPK